MENNVEIDLKASGWSAVGSDLRSFGPENVETSGYFTRDLVNCVICSLSLGFCWMHLRSLSSKENDAMRSLLSRLFPRFYCYRLFFFTC